MTKETEMLEYNDVLCDWNSLVTQYGCRRVLQDFRDFYPEMFNELLVQINRLPTQRQTPWLFKEPGEGNSDAHSG